MTLPGALHLVDTAVNYGQHTRVTLDSQKKCRIDTAPVSPEKKEKLAVETERDDAKSKVGETIVFNTVMIDNSTII